MKVAEKLLDMSPDAVDYICSKCRQDAIEKFVNSGLLNNELSLSLGFQKAWNKSQCTKQIKGGIKEHTAALLAYANGDRGFITEFNSEVETKGGNTTRYDNDFNYKAFHFLLMDYMMLQKPQTCQAVYLLLDTKQTAKIKSTVRLGRFTTAVLNFDSLKQMHDFDSEVILNITSCLFAKLGDNICKVNKEDVLLSPSEEFIVENSVTVVDTEDDVTYTMITLNHVSLGDLNNCHICSR